MYLGWTDVPVTAVGTARIPHIPRQNQNDTGMALNLLRSFLLEIKLQFTPGKYDQVMTD